MKFALINGNKTEATKGAKGICRSCGSGLIAKCGEIKVNHWAHKGNRDCDPWWENETDWHRSWKDKFSIDWQEVVHVDEKSGEKHIADVKTESGWVLEFQYSYLKPEERRSRNAFYNKLVWVVNGLRRKTDIKQFENILQKSAVVWKDPLILRVNFPDECRLLKEWHNSDALVFFDLEAKETKQSKLWFLFPGISTGEAYLSTFSRVEFIESLNKNVFDEIVSKMILPIRDILASSKQIERENNIHPNRLSILDRHLANRRRRKKRL